MVHKLNGCILVYLVLSCYGTQSQWLHLVHSSLMMISQESQIKSTITSKQPLVMENNHALFHPMHDCHLYMDGGYEGIAS